MSTKTEQAEAINQLREILNPGDTVHTVLRHVSSSGMTRHISVVIVRDGEPVDISWSVARAMGWTLAETRSTNRGVKVGGCGMDMGFHLVYSLSRTLYPEGHACTGESGYGADRCPSNDHSNDRTADYRTDRVHSDGGYALKQRWL